MIGLNTPTISWLFGLVAYKWFCQIGKLVTKNLLAEYNLWTAKVVVVSLPRCDGYLDGPLSAIIAKLWLYTVFPLIIHKTGYSVFTERFPRSQGHFGLEKISKALVHKGSAA